MEQEVSKVINSYFSKHSVGSAKEIFNKTGRKFPHNAICHVLEELVEQGVLDMRVAPGTKHIRAHYEFVLINKKESPIKRFFRSIFGIK